MSRWRREPEEPVDRGILRWVRVQKDHQSWQLFVYPRAGNVEEPLLVLNAGIHSGDDVYRMIQNALVGKLCATCGKPDPGDGMAVCLPCRSSAVADLQDALRD